VDPDSGATVAMPARVRLCPYYFVTGEGDAARPQLGGVLATLNPADKKIIHGMTDAMLLRRFKLPDWTVAQTEDQYVAGALRMIDEDELRAELGAQALALDINTLMFGDGTTPLASDVIDLVWTIYENHNAVMASPLRALKLADVEAIAAASGS
jgi:hypothetical protein